MIARRSCRSALGGRAVDMYKSGGSMSFLGVLMGVSSFDDFVNMWTRCSASRSRTPILIDESKQVRTEAAEAQASFEGQSQIAADEMTAAQAAKDEIEATKSTMETELAKVTEEVALLQGQEESVRLSAEEAKQREEEAARVAASYSASAGINDYSGGGSYSDSGNSYTGGGGGASAIGGWVNPCPSYYGVTCEFGYSPSPVRTTASTLALRRARLSWRPAGHGHVRGLVRHRAAMPSSFRTATACAPSTCTKAKRRQRWGKPSTPATSSATWAPRACQPARTCTSRLRSTVRRSIHATTTASSEKAASGRLFAARSLAGRRACNGSSTVPLHGGIRPHNG